MLFPTAMMAVWKPRQADAVLHKRTIPTTVERLPELKAISLAGLGIRNLPSLQQTAQIEVSVHTTIAAILITNLVLGAL